jgi:hypothetical protein
VTDEPSDIIRLTAATRALAAILTPGDAVAVIRLADKARELARTMELGTEAENAATSIRLKAEIRLAEVVAEGQKKGEIASPGAPGKVRVADLSPATLADIGVSKQRLSEARDIAGAMGPGQVDAMIAEANDRGQTLSRAAVLKEVRRADATIRDHVIGKRDRSLTNEERDREMIARMRVVWAKGMEALSRIISLDPATYVPFEDSPDPVLDGLVKATRKWLDRIEKEQAAKSGLRLIGDSRAFAESGGSEPRTTMAVSDLHSDTAEEAGRDAAQHSD